MSSNRSEAARLREDKANLMANVSAGAEWLDKAWPGWFEQINTEQLNIMHCTFCVIGQLIGSYNEQHLLSKYLLSELGFNVEPYYQLGGDGYHLDGMTSWDYMNQLWVDEIECRLADA